MMQLPYAKHDKVLNRWLFINSHTISMNISHQSMLEKYILTVANECHTPFYSHINRPLIEVLLAGI